MLKGSVADAKDSVLDAKSSVKERKTPSNSNATTESNTTTELALRPVPPLSKSKGTALSYINSLSDLSKPISFRASRQKPPNLACRARVTITLLMGLTFLTRDKFLASLPDVWLRKSVADKLAKVNQQLAPLDLEVHIFDGYRPIETQEALWQHFIEKGASAIKD